MRLIVSFLFLISLSVSSAYGAGIRLENASYNSALSIFAAMTGKTYVGDFKTNKVNEKSDVNPKEAYGTMKLAGEIITKGISKLNNIPYTIIRPSAVYGPTDMNLRVSQYFIGIDFSMLTPLKNYNSVYYKNCCIFGNISNNDEKAGLIFGVALGS